MNRVELSKGYEPKDVESRWSAFQENNNSYTPSPDNAAEHYSIVIPPPNVTGALHMGHALNITLQDILCRFYRMQGRNVLWVPGTDHAGIATQNVVERALGKEGKSREDLGREAFIERVWKWKEEYGGRILNQIKRLGASVDWTRTRFTMDEGLSRAVREVFVRLYEDGLIYRGDYIINWCVRCHTALADLEVEYSPANSSLYHIRYPLADGTGHLVVATTRPETMLGDTAVAVHPEDERYTAYIGAQVRLPLTGRTIPVIADAYVEREFGTGCLKVTPGHDVNDFELGKRHNLEIVRAMDAFGKMTEITGAEFAGLDRYECRKKVVEMLKDGGLLEKEEPYGNNVGLCYRCKSVIEPRVSRQWFVAVKPLAEKARHAVEAGKTRIVPEQWTKTYYEWMDNIRDWCISRQIWWGHRIPAWTCSGCQEMIVSRETPKACPKCASSALGQDNDVLDTWFSSALWPFSTLGWPDDTPELKKYYPTSVLVTGFDILFFWVARMMMMGIRFMDEVPFKDVYIHALVRDAEGKKMSKSTGNVIDPLDMIDKYGTDSLRFTLASFAAMGRDIKLSEERIDGYRHFINKLWNAARFSLMNLPDEVPPLEPERIGSLAHKWILHRLEEVKEQVKITLEGYHFNEAAQCLYQFVWHELCDWYLEMIKPELYGEDESAKRIAQSVLRTVLSETLLLLHPFIPFVTWEIWSVLPGVSDTDLSRAIYPDKRDNCRHPAAVAEMTLLQDVVIGVRNIRSELGIAPGVKLDAYVRISSEEDVAFLKDCESMVKSLARLDKLVAMRASDAAPRASAGTVAHGREIFVPLEGHVDFASEISRLEKEIGKLNKELDIVNKKLSNQGFLDKAPQDVVEKEKLKAGEMDGKRVKLVNLRDRLKAFSR